MSIKIGTIEFDHHSYDEEGDVLYLSVGEPRVPAETDATSEGHAVDFDADGNVIGMIIVNLRFLLERDGELRSPGPRRTCRPRSSPRYLRQRPDPAQSASSSSSRGRRNRHVRPSRLAGSSPRRASW